MIATGDDSLICPWKKRLLRKEPNTHFDRRPHIMIPVECTKGIIKISQPTLGCDTRLLDVPLYGMGSETASSDRSLPVYHTLAPIRWPSFPILS